MNRQIKNILKRAFFSIHKLGIRFGIHVIPVHYYSPIPNVLELEKTKNVWAKKSELPGINIDLDEYCNNLKTIMSPYQNEYVGNKVYLEGVSHHFGQGFGYIEAQALHGVLRYYKPNKIIEVGSGVSTYCTLAALEMNEKETGHSCQLTCIEPYPSDKLRELIEERKIKHIFQQVQTVPFEVFTELRERDVLFIDGSHAVKPGSDVNYLILEVLPRLRKGVIVHFHDVFMPYDYDRSVLQTLFHWTETSLLQAFLIFNEKFNIIFCLSQLHYDRKDILREMFPEYNPQFDTDGILDKKYKAFEPIAEHFPSSIYIQKQ